MRTMAGCARLLLLAVLPALAGWCADGAEGPVLNGPSFGPQQTLAAVAAVGASVTFDCEVRGLADKQVSWVRSRDLHIMSYAGGVFTADSRVSASTRGDLHSLSIERLRASDAGQYECQVNTEPKMSLFFNLTVLEGPLPVAVVRVTGPKEVSAEEGGVASLSCEVRYEPPPMAAVPLPPLELHWSKEGRDVVVAQRSVALQSERRRWRVHSTLTLASLSLNDTGEYACSSGTRRAVVLLHVLRRPLSAAENQMEAMQRDEQSSASVSRGSVGNVSASLLLLLLIHILLSCKYCVILVINR